MLSLTLEFRRPVYRYSWVGETDLHATLRHTEQSIVESTVGGLSINIGAPCPWRSEVLQYRGPFTTQSLPRDSGLERVPGGVAEVYDTDTLFPAR